MYRCHICGEIQVSPYQLHKHLINTHSIEEGCNQFGKGVTTRAQRKNTQSDSLSSGTQSSSHSNTTASSKKRKISSQQSDLPEKSSKKEEENRLRDSLNSLPGSSGLQQSSSKPSTKEEENRLRDSLQSEPGPSGLQQPVSNLESDIKVSPLNEHSKDIKDEFDDKIHQPPEIPNEGELNNLLRENWPAIRSRFRCRPTQDILNVRLWDPLKPDAEFSEEVWLYLLKLWRQTKCRIKINCSLGLILENRTNNQLRYYHASSNNARVFDTPTLIRTEADLKELYHQITTKNLRAIAQRARPNTRWRLRYITNLTFYSYKLLKMGKIGKGVHLPDYILQNPHILSLNKSLRGKIFEDNLCFFRCLAIKLNCTCACNAKCICRSVSETLTNHLLHKYIQATKVNVTSSSICEFEGVACEDLLAMEKIFQLNIIVMELYHDGSSDVIWSSGQNDYSKTMYLHLYDKHFSYIKNIDHFAQAFTCQTCKTTYKRFHTLKIHKCRADKRSTFVFPGGEFCSPYNIFSSLYQLSGIKVKDDMMYHPYRITYDIECMLTKDNLPEDTETMNFTSLHKLLSVSVCSNVPGFDKPRCFVRDINSDSPVDCVEQFVEYIETISNESTRLLMKRFSEVFTALKCEVDRVESIETRFEHHKFSQSAKYNNRKKLCGIQSKLIGYISRIPVVGFNSGKYDINVIKGILLKTVHAIDDEGFNFAIKRLNNMVCIETSKFRFVDIINFIAPGFSYDQYLKAFGCSATKGFFPYEWMDRLDKLNQSYLPSKECFASSLRGTTLTNEEYEVCVKAWQDNNMTTFKDFLIWYNNLDVAPFLEAIDKQSNIYKSRKIDMLKEAISLPGLSVKWLFTETIEDDRKRKENILSYDYKTMVNTFQDCQPIYLIDHSNNDMYRLIKDNIVGGPSIVFHRYHEKMQTQIRSRVYGENSKLCQSVLGIDANALYLWSMGQPMPTGLPHRRLEEDNFQTSNKFIHHSKSANGWLEYMARSRGLNIKRCLLGGEYRVGNHGLPVDGFCEENREVFQFHGCYWHGHECIFHKDEIHPTRERPVSEIYKETLEKEEYIKALGFKFTRIWECEWSNHVSNNPEIKLFLKAFYSTIYPKKPKQILEDIIQDIASGKIFGLIECDIEVPPELEDYFGEMAPIFKNIDVARKDLGEHMRQFSVETNRLAQPQPMLIGSLFGKKILLLSELAKWYINHGLKITRIYQIIEYIPRSIFSSFTSSVSEARRAGDKDSNLKLLADTSKLVGNSAYGKTITNKEKHSNVVYVDGCEDASARIRRANFLHLDEIEEEFFEIESSKNTIKMDNPMIIGFCILQYSKLRMLQLYYNFIDRYIDRKDFEYVEMDTDSAYMALSAKNLEDVIIPEMKEEFYKEYSKWLPRPYCSNHAQSFKECKMTNGTWTMQECCRKVLMYDNRTPGLFKEEFKGNGIIALNSKTYYCWNEEEKVKLSSKGLSKTTNQLTKDMYLNVLKDGIEQCGVNRGFIKRHNKIYTYEQVRTGLSYFYAKRIVCSDGVSTLNIRI